MYKLSYQCLEQDNTIEVVIKRGSVIYVYGNNGDILCTKTGDEVIGYTCKAFTIRTGKTIHIYNAYGKQMYTKPAIE